VGSSPIVSTTCYLTRAILRLFADTGLRLSELAHLTVADVDLDEHVAVVLGKGRRPRAVPFGAKTTAALDRYLRLRGRHKVAAEPALWLGPNNRQAMTVNGVGQMVRRSGAEAGIPELHPHMLRHTFAHSWLAEGGNEGDLMRITGCKSRAMVNRYGPRQPTSAPATPTVVSAWATDCDLPLAGITTPSAVGVPARTAVRARPCGHASLARRGVSALPASARRPDRPGARSAARRPGVPERLERRGRSSAPTTCGLPTAPATTAKPG
jgi:Phage integrase family